jgi:hypothetical protein
MKRRLISTNSPQIRGNGNSQIIPGKWGERMWSGTSHFRKREKKEISEREGTNWFSRKQKRRDSKTDLFFLTPFSGRSVFILIGRYSSLLFQDILGNSLREDLSSCENKSFFSSLAFIPLYSFLNLIFPLSLRTLSVLLM